MATAAAKPMAVEKIYQKKSQLEHILLRPDTYIGSVEMLDEEMWIWDIENEKMIKKQIKFVPGLYKIFDEILVNAADNKQRDPNMTLIRVNIDKENNTIRIYNNGRGIPVVEHKDEKVLVPTLIFGHLLTSSNYNDEEKKVTGGRNGFGAKLCNIFSKKFILETSSREYKKSFKQVWTSNMSNAEAPVIKDAKEDDFTCITFVPDLTKFKMSHLDDDTISLLARRAYDIAASTPNVRVYLNDKKLPITKFEDYCKLYLSGCELDEAGNPPKLIYEKVSERWEVAVACSDIGFQQVSFVNSIATTKGGRHVDYVADQLVKHLTDVVNKKNKGGSQVKPFQIKSHMWLYINCLIENPTFDSQTKENMTLQMKSFGSKCQLTEEFYKRVAKSGLLERILTWLAFKEKTDLEKAGSKSKMSKIKGIPKLDDANDAGTKESLQCTLIVTEGDSAKTLAVAGLGVIGRDRYGVFPLRGKMLNVREATTRQIIENNEVSSLLKIIGLNFKEKYESRESLKQLRYGKLMIMTDQDHDGSHIKGLIINFIHYQWPNLLKHNFVEEFITPIVKVSKGTQEKSFYSMPEFEEWQQNTANWNSWKVKYYKGLGTSTSKEAKEYFSDMQRHRIKFEYSNMRDDLAIQLAFSKRFIEERKDWLTRYMEEKKLRRETNGVDDYLYQKDTKGITYTDFVNKELVLFSNLDNERSIPSLVDGFKPGQRKVLFTCFKRNLVRELKVAQLAGSVAELSAYHHGETSLMSTIINLAQNFVGSNNINLLQPIGQFGTRLHGGKDAASPRYIFTCMSPLTRLLFNPKDDPLFTYLNDDGTRVEPEFYCPIIPTVLVNGAEGIGTGWAVKVPNYDPREIIANLRRMIDGQEPKAMMPFYKNFRGKVERVDDVRVVTHGEVAIVGENAIEITELPIGVWTQHYKESVLEVYLHGNSEKQEKVLISDYKEYHTDTTVRFVVRMTPEQFRAADSVGLHKFFKLQKALSLNSMVLFDHNGCIKRYDSINDILKEFFELRASFYKKRKSYMEGMLAAESLKLDNIARFIIEKIEGKIRVENLKRAEICRILKERNYDPDPVAKWKAKVQREHGLVDQTTPSQQEEEEGEAEEVGDDAASSNDKHDYDYILGMPIWNLTMEKKDEILKQQKNKGDELKLLRSKTHLRLWQEDLDQFSEELDKVEGKEREDDAVAQLKAYKAGVASKSSTLLKKTTNSKLTKLEYMPAPDGQRIEAKLDPSLVPKTTAPKSEPIKKELNIVDIITNSVSEARRLDDAEIAKFVVNMNKPQKATREAKPKAEKKTTTATKSKVKSEDPDMDILSDSNPASDISEKKQPKKAAAKSTSSTKLSAKKSNDDPDMDVLSDSNPVSDISEKKPKATKTTSSSKLTTKSTTTTTTTAAKKEQPEKNSIKNYFSKSKKAAEKSDDDEESEASIISDNDDSFASHMDEEDDDGEPIQRRVISRARKQVNYFASDDETPKAKIDTAKSNKKADADDEIVFDISEESSKDSVMVSLKAPVKKAIKKYDSSDDLKIEKATKPAAKKKTTTFDDIIDDSDDSKDSVVSLKPKKTTKKIYNDDDDDDDDFQVEEIKKTTAKKTTKKILKDDVDDDDDFQVEKTKKTAKKYLESDEDDDFKKIAESKSKKSPISLEGFDDDDDNDAYAFKSTKTNKPALSAKKDTENKPAKKTVERIVVSDDDDDKDDQENRAPSKKVDAAVKPKPKEKRRRKKYTYDSDDDDVDAANNSDDDDFIVADDDDDYDYDHDKKRAKVAAPPKKKTLLPVADIFTKTKKSATESKKAKRDISKEIFY